MIENGKISVLMGIYNCENTLEDSIESIISQTYSNWELIICDDGSVDSTYIIAEKYQNKYPKKITLLKNEKNMGLHYTLNKCFSHANGEYIARMDADDISLPKRFEKEVNFLNQNSKFSFVGTSMICFDEKGPWGINRCNEIPKAKDLVKGTQFCHPTCLIRVSAFRAVGGYTVNKRTLRAEDYHLWLKMYKNGFVGFNLQESLYKMRDNRDSAKRRTYKSRINEAYVKYLIVKELNLPKWNYVHLLRPLIVGLLPINIYFYLHKKLMNIREGVFNDT